MAKLGNTVSDSSPVDSVKLFRRLHESRESAAEVIDEIGSQVENLRPEDIINNALRLESPDAVHLLRLVESTTKPIDLSNLSSSGNFYQGSEIPVEVDLQ